MKKAFVTALMAGALAATPAFAWEKGEKVPDISKYEMSVTQRAVYNTPVGVLVRQTYMEDGEPAVNIFSRMCNGKLQPYAYYDFNTQEVALDNDPTDGVFDSVYKDRNLAPHPMAAVPDCK